MTARNFENENLFMDQVTSLGTRFKMAELVLANAKLDVCIRGRGY